MILERDVLESKKIPELRLLLTKMGAGFSDNESKKELIDRYEELSAAVQPNEEKPQEVSAPVTKEDPWLKRESVLAECKKYLQIGLRVDFDPDCKVWHMTLQRGNVTLSDCGSMKQPLKRVALCAEMLCRPKFLSAEKLGGLNGGTPLADAI